MRVRENEKLDVGDMKGDALERKPLPIGKTEFYQWSDRIIEMAGLECDPEADKKAHVESQRFALAGMLMTIGTTEAFREDAYFALALRTAAVKQTAHYMAQEIRDARKPVAETDPNTGTVNGLLENKTV